MKFLCLKPLNCKDLSFGVQKMSCSRELSLHRAPESWALVIRILDACEV